MELLTNPKSEILKHHSFYVAQNPNHSFNSKPPNNNLFQILWNFDFVSLWNLIHENETTLLDDLAYGERNGNICGMLFFLF